MNDGARAVVVRLDVADERDQLGPGARAVALDDGEAIAVDVVPVLLAALDDAVELLGRTTELIVAVVDVVGGFAGAGRRGDGAQAARGLVAGRDRTCSWRTPSPYSRRRVD